jgi:hypothetical protein
MEKARSEKPTEKAGTEKPTMSKSSLKNAKKRSPRATMNLKRI